MPRLELALYIMAPPDRCVHDVFDYDAPLGPLGWLAERLFLSRYMHKFLLVRLQELKVLAESSAWLEFLPPTT